LIFKGILNGCSTNIVAQAEELNGFISEYLSSEDNIGSTIIFYSKKEEKDELLRLVPTESVALVRITLNQPENILKALITIAYGEVANLYLFPSDFAGAELAVRLAFRMKGSSIVRAQHLKCLREQLIVKKMVYSSHVLGTFRLTKKPYCVSLAKGSAHGQPIRVKDKLKVTEYDMTHLHKAQCIKVLKLIPDEPSKDLANAKFLLIGGNGMNSKENTQNLKHIAETIGADFGVSRPAAMSAWAPMNRMIGVSGAMTKADICIVAGVSGAAAFYAGIEKSKYIVAINKDLRAPIVKTADVTIIDDYKAVMDELVKIMRE